MAGVTWWSFYLRLYPGTIRSPQVIEFLTHLLRLRPASADRLGWPAESPQPNGVGLRAPAARALVVGVSADTATGNLVTTLAKHYGGCRRPMLVCSVLAAGRAVSSVTKLCDTQ